MVGGGAAESQAPVLLYSLQPMKESRTSSHPNGTGKATPTRHQYKSDLLPKGCVWRLLGSVLLAQNPSCALEGVVLVCLLAVLVLNVALCLQVVLVLVCSVVVLVLCGGACWYALKKWCWRLLALVLGL